MLLKREMKRKSCDFCFRRKIKCDRSARISEDIDKCSQCALRQVSCQLDDSDDVRIRRRRGNFRRKESSKICQLKQRQVAWCDVYEKSQRAVNIPFVNINISLTSANIQLDSSTNRHSTTHSVDSSISSLSSLEVNVATFSQDTIDQGSSLDFSFELSSDSLFFLDQIFMREIESMKWIDQSFITDQVSEQTRDYHGGISVTSRVNDDRSQAFYQTINVDSIIFIAALLIYFDSAALCLFILFEDAFWQDYNADWCSLILIFVIACCGISFTTAEDKWQF